MRWSSYALDHYIAPKLSILVVCGAKKLDAPSRLAPLFILSSIFSFKLRDDLRAGLFGLVRRIDHAFYEYERGRDLLSEFVSDRSKVPGPYFRALAHFEQCLAALYQGAMFIRMLSGQDLFKSGDGSTLSRINLIHNDSKHMESVIAQGRLPSSATTAVWLTNDGLESSTASVTFGEIADLMLEIHQETRSVIAGIRQRVLEQSEKLD